MLVAAGQFAVTSVWEKNAEICASLMAQAAEPSTSSNGAISLPASTRRDS
mgnify:CR=1 FL=1